MRTQPNRARPRALLQEGREAGSQILLLLHRWPRAGLRLTGTASEPGESPNRRLQGWELLLPSQHIVRPEPKIAAEMLTLWCIPRRSLLSKNPSKDLYGPAPKQPRGCELFLRVPQLPAGCPLPGAGAASAVLGLGSGHQNGDLAVGLLPTQPPWGFPARAAPAGKAGGTSQPSCGDQGQDLAPVVRGEAAALLPSAFFGSSP